MYFGKIAESVRPKTAISLNATPKWGNPAVKRKESDNNLTDEDFLEGKYINIFV